MTMSMKMTMMLARMWAVHAVRPLCVAAVLWRGGDVDVDGHHLSKGESGFVVRSSV